MSRLMRVSVVTLTSLLLTVACGPASQPDEIRSDLVLDVYSTSDEELWVSTSDGLSYFGEGYGEVPLSAVNRYVWGAAVDSSGTVWIASATGIFRYDPQLDEEPKLLESVPASAIAVGADDTVWAATHGYGIAKIVDGATVSWFRMEDGLPSDDVLSILVSEDGGIWAGTSNGMANFDQGDVWTSVEAMYGLHVFDIAEDYDKLFVATDSGAFSSPNHNTWDELPGTKNRFVTAITSFQDDLIFGTKNSELLVYPSGNTVGSPTVLTNSVLGLQADTITALAPWRNEELVLGTFGGGITTYTADNWEALLTAETP